MGEASPLLVPELAVSDWQASRAFYCDVLGFTPVYARPEEGFVYLTRGGLHLMLDQIGAGRSFDSDLSRADRPFGRGLNLQMKVPEIAPLVAALAAEGLPIFLPPEDRWYRKDAVETGNRQFIVADPDGYLLRFFQDLGERPAPVG